MLFPYRREREVWGINILSEFVGVTPERLLSVILDYQRSDDKVMYNLFFCDYNPAIKEESTSIVIHLTSLGEHAVKMCDEEYWRECIEKIKS